MVQLEKVNKVDFNVLYYSSLPFKINIYLFFSTNQENKKTCFQQVHKTYETTFGFLF